MSIGSSNTTDSLLPVPTPHQPFRVEEGGVARVGRSRVTLDVVIEQYENGMTPEAIVQAYDSLELVEVHEVLAYYLRHQPAVRAYLERRREVASELRVKIESQSPRLMADDIRPSPASQG